MNYQKTHCIVMTYCAEDIADCVKYEGIIEGRLVWTLERTIGDQGFKRWSFVQHDWLSTDLFNHIGDALRSATRGNYDVSRAPMFGAWDYRTGEPARLDNNQIVTHAFSTCIKCTIKNDDDDRKARPLN